VSGPARRLVLALLLALPLPAGTAAQSTSVADVPEEISALLPEVIGEGSVTVHFEAADSAFARAVLERVLSQPLLPAIPVGFPHGARIFLPRSEAAIDALLGGRRPEWSAGLALPNAGWIVLPVGRGEPTGRRDLLDDVLRHEWAHIGQHQAAGGYRAPRWFVEGYAEYAAGWDTETAWRLRVALAADDSLGLNAFTLDWPRSRSESEIAYLVSASVIDYLVEASGEAGLSAFITRWREGGRFEEALRRTYGVSSSQLEDDWKAWARDRYGWLYVLTRSGIGWGILAGLFFALVWARRRYRKDRMAELRAREIPDAPDWWTAEEGPVEGRGGLPAPTSGIFPERAAGEGEPGKSLEREGETR
jgi:hypothetical protein